MCWALARENVPYYYVLDWARLYYVAIAITIYGICVVIGRRHVCACIGYSKRIQLRVSGTQNHGFSEQKY